MILGPPKFGQSIWPPGSQLKLLVQSLRLPSSYQPMLCIHSALTFSKLREILTSIMSFFCFLEISLPQDVPLIFEFISFLDAIFPFLFLSRLVACSVYFNSLFNCHNIVANQKGQRQSSKPIKTRRNYTWPTQSVGNVQAQAMIGFGFTSIG